MGKKKKKHKKKGQIVQKRSSSGIVTAVVIVLAVFAVAVLLLKSGVFNDTKGGSSVDRFEDKPKPIATIEMENGGLIKVELDPVNAPNTVRNFIALADEGFYDGLIFHRVIPDFMIQGGCPEGTGRGGPGYSIKGEFASNGFTNGILHHRGVISMARSQSPDSAGSQFFITVAEAPHLDNEYAAFGTVIEGMDVVDRIAEVPRDEEDKPLEDQSIKQITVEKFGVEYDPPEKVQ